MPDIILHLIAGIFLIILIYLFDKKVKEEKYSFFYICLAVIGSNLIDIDHLLANPIYDPNRCSINFHPLHSWYFLPLWVLGFLSKNRYVMYFSLSVLIHLWLDWMDCTPLL